MSDNQTIVAVVSIICLTLLIAFIVYLAGRDE